MRTIKAKLTPILLSLLFSIGTGCLPAQDKAMPTEKDDLHIYLLIGQSNMAGRATIPEDDAGIIERTYLLNDQDEWVPATNPLNRYSTIRKELSMQRLGPGSSFARAMLKQQDDVAIGLIVNAKGGSRIEEWEKGTHFYQEAVRRTRAAQNAGTLKGILWHQGESNKGRKSEGYLAALATLIENLRADLGDSALPFVAGQVNDLPEINQQIARLPERVAATGFIRSEGLETTDRWHFDTKSVEKMGRRYAEEMRKLQ